MSRRKEVVIVGGGASGMLAAILTARQGMKVMLIEKNKTLGKKLSATGNGRCNFTNEQMNRDCYYSNDITFVDSVLQHFGWQDTVFLFREFGILERSREGYVYPKSNQASTVVDKLKSSCETYGVEILLEETVEQVAKTPKGFFVMTDKQSIYSDYLVLACGGIACPELGGTKSGYQLARQFNHNITPLYPALTGFLSKGKWLPEFAGVRILGKLSIYTQGKLLAEEEGEIQCTKTGISGIPAFQLCHLVSEALKNGEVYGEIDFLPEMKKEEVLSFLTMQSEKFSVEDVLKGMINSKCVKEIIRRGSSLTDVAETLKAFYFPIEMTAGFEKAQVTAGGVSLQEICRESMESKKIEGLYVTGELLDADGICGGYNLQWAWATAYLCAEDIIRKEGKCHDRD